MSIFQSEYTLAFLKVSKGMFTCSLVSLMCLGLSLENVQAASGSAKKTEASASSPSSSPASSSSSSPTVNSLLFEGVTLQKEGELDQAFAKFQQVSERGDPRGFLRSAIILALQEKYSDASEQLISFVKTFDKLPAAAKDNEQAILGSYGATYVKTLQNLKDPKNLIDAHIEFQGRKGQKATMQAIQFAIVKLTEVENKLVTEYYDQLLQNMPSPTKEVMMGAALAYLKHEMPEKALPAFTKARELGSPLAGFQEITLLLKQKKVDDIVDIALALETNEDSKSKEKLIRVMRLQMAAMAPGKLIQVTNELRKKWAAGDQSIDLMTVVMGYALVAAKGPKLKASAIQNLTIMAQKGNALAQKGLDIISGYDNKLPKLKEIPVLLGAPDFGNEQS